jgi:hypothetical protein
MLVTKKSSYCKSRQKAFFVFIGDLLFRFDDNMTIGENPHIKISPLIIISGKMRFISITNL